MEELIKIELTPEEIELFKFMREHQGNIEKIKDFGIFEFSAKTVHLHIDPCGRIKDADIVIRSIARKQ